MDQLLLTTNAFSTFYPGNYQYEIDRNNLLDTLEKMTETSDIISVSGETATGKTVLLKQFCERKETISIFISQAKPISASLEITLIDLIKQINFLTKGQVITELPNSIPQLKIMYTRALSQLSYYASSGNVVYLVIDGLYHAADTSDAIIEALLQELIPFGKKNIKVIISKNDEPDQLSAFINAIPYRKKELSMIGINSNEVGLIFKDLNLEEQTIEDIRLTFLGNPSDIVELRNILEKEDLDIDRIPQNIFEYLWKKQNYEDETFLRLFSLIVFSSKDLNLDELSSILDISPAKVVKEIEGNPFMSIENGIPKIKNETYLKRLEKKLDSKKKETYDLLATFILAKGSKNDYWLLTKYYEGSEKYAELISILDNSDYIDSVLSSNSMSSLRLLVGSGLRTSNKIDSLTNIYKYSLENSLIKAQSNSNNGNEIEALMLLQQENKALSIARNSRVIEEKIHLLSMIARIQKKNRGIVDPQLIDEIKKIYENLNLDYIGEKGVAIASELIAVDVDLAIGLLERTFELESDNNALDKMMVALSIDSLSEGASEPGYELFENIKDRVKDPELKNIFSTMFNFSKSISPKNLIQELEKIDSLNAKITFLSNWCDDNDTGEKRLEILEYGFNQLSTSNDYKSNAGIYFKLSNQLLFDDIGEYEKIIELFDSRRELLEENGPTVFYVRLTLNIINCLDKNNKEAAVNRIDDLYTYVDKIEDISIKLECKSYILRELKKYKNSAFYEEQLRIIEILQTELEAELTEITSNFAYQEDLLGKTIQVLANTDFDFCLSTVNNVNTVVNREKLYSNLIDGLVDQGILNTTDNVIDGNILGKVVDIANIIKYDLDIYDHSIFYMIDSLNLVATEKGTGLTCSQSTFYKILNSINNIRDTRRKTLSLAMLLNIFSDTDFVNQQNIEDSMKNSWNSIDILPRKISIGYELVTTLTKKRFDIATSFINEIQDEKVKNSQFNTEEFWTFIMSLRLLIHAFRGVNSEKHSHLIQSMEKIKSLIDTVESFGEQAILYSMLLLDISNKTSQVAVKEILTIINKKIDGISNEDTRFKAYVLSKCAPALYLNSPSYLEANIDLLSPREKDNVYSSLCIYYLTKTDNYQPFDLGSNAKYNYSYEDILEVVNLISKIEQDSLKYVILKLLLGIIRDNQGTQLNQERMNDLKQRIRSTINNSFTSNQFIQHDGYKIISEYYHWICFDSYQKDKVNTFLERIKEIPNISDRIFCMTSIASEIRPKDHQLRDDILADAEIMIDELNSTSEKILRLEDMADSIKSKKHSKEKYYIQKALDLIDDQENKKMERRLIDLAYQLDSEFANSLVSSIKGTKLEIESKKKRYKNRINLLALNEKVRNDKGKEDFSTMEYEEAANLGDACWKSYSNLMAGSIAARKPIFLKKYLQIGSTLSIEQSFPIFSWFLENSNRKSDKSSRNEFFEATYIACKFALTNKQYSEKSLQDIETYFQKESMAVSITEENVDEAKKFIAEKLSKGTIENIIITDPYFDKDDLKFIFELYQLLEEDDLIFSVITGPKRYKNSYDDEKNDEEFREYWKDKVSSENPPNICVIVATDKVTGDSPFHDRYMISNEHGVSLGGSINGLGKSKEININVLPEDTRRDRAEYFSHYVSNDLFFFKRNSLEVSTKAFYI